MSGGVCQKLQTDQLTQATEAFMFSIEGSFIFDK